MDQPGPGLYPLFVGVLVMVTSIGGILTELLNPTQGKVELPGRKDLGRMLMVLGGALIYVLFLPYLGHLLSSTLTVFVVLHAMGLSLWYRKIALTIVISVMSYYLFVVFLKVPLPQGLLG